MAGGRKNQPKPIVNVNPDIVKTIASSLASLLNQFNPPQPVNHDPDQADLSSVLHLLLQLVMIITKQVKSVETDVGVRSKEGEGCGGDAAERVHVDELDECRQRTLKGNLIITSQALPAKNKVCLLKTEQQLQQEGKSLTDHIIDLVKEKFNVDLPPEDIQVCHRLPSNAVLLRIWNRKSGSAWGQMLDGIKTGFNIGINVFFNFQLTKRRSGLLYKLRQLRKSGEIEKYYSDESGQLTVMVKKKEEHGKKDKITYYSKSKTSTPFTYTEEELVELVRERKSRSWAEAVEAAQSST